MPPAPSPQSVSRLLAGAGFERSVSRPSAVKGWHEWSAGYKVRTGYVVGEVHVEHRVSSLRLRDPSSRDEEAAKLAAYAKTITGAGWAVKPGADKLIVTAKEG